VLKKEEREEVEKKIKEIVQTVGWVEVSSNKNCFSFVKPKEIHE
jgi:hypothetical protein